MRIGSFQYTFKKYSKHLMPPQAEIQAPLLVALVFMFDMGSW